MAEDTREYRFVGSHAEILANGRPVEPGEYVDLTDEEIAEPHNSTLLSDGLLMEITEETTYQEEIATEAAKELADAEGVDLTQVSATGATGLITKGDVENYIAENDKGEES